MSLALSMDGHSVSDLYLCAETLEISEPLH